MALPPCAYFVEVDGNKIPVTVTEGDGLVVKPQLQEGTMTRLIRSSRIGGKRSKTRRCAPGTTMAAALAASVAVLAIGGVSSLDPIGAVSAQTPGTAGPISLGDLFDGPGSVDLKAGATSQLNAAITNASMLHCRTQKANITVVMAAGDPLFQEALGRARRDAIDAVLKQHGVATERYAVAYGGVGAKDAVQVEYGEIIPDKEKPKLDTNSDPRKGAKVKANGKIVVTMVATDRANQWQTGIKSIQLQDISTNPNGILIPMPADYGRLPNPCNAATMQRTHVVTYTVPPNPPPIVRLRAIAEDFAGNIDTDIGEFPTGDWHGRIDWWIPTPAGRQWGRLDLAFDYDGRGNLKGQAAGDDHAEAQSGTCRMITQTPSRITANLIGQYTPGRNSMSLGVVDPQIEQGQFKLVDCGAAPGGPFGGGGAIGQPGLSQLLSNLGVRPDGSVEASGEWPVAPASATPTTLHLKLSLRRATD